ncbi:hypothetical protein LCGC14_1266990 [marine sediment metagenome]|uniref:Uncharacterized protein n=1 Tax=marine sediment metagenome TaxID=412755 RepID=A0A0F9LKA5_9ZZZZ
MDPYEQLAKALRSVIDLTHDTWQKRAEEMQEACASADVDLDEFLSWFDK